MTDYPAADYVERDRLKPWQRLPSGPCHSCPAVPVWRVWSTEGVVGYEIVDDEVRAVLAPDAVRHEALACEEHYHHLATLWCDLYGGSCSELLRYTWRYWLETRAYAAWQWVRRTSP